MGTKYEFQVIKISLAHINNAKRACNIILPFLYFISIHLLRDGPKEKWWKDGLPVREFSFSFNCNPLWKIYLGKICSMPFSLFAALFLLST